MALSSSITAGPTASAIFLFGVLLLIVSTTTRGEILPELTAKLQAETKSLKNETSFKLHSKGLNETKYINAITELCLFYETIEEYRVVTANQSDNKTDAVNAVMNQVFIDSCIWLKTLGHLTSNFECSHINSPNVIELCSIMTVNSVVGPMLSLLQTMTTSDTTGAGK